MTTTPLEPAVSSTKAVSSWAGGICIAAADAEVSSFAEPIKLQRECEHLQQIPTTVGRMFSRRHMISHRSLSPSYVLEQLGQQDASLPDLKTALIYRDMHRSLAQQLLGRSDLGDAQVDELKKAVPEYGFYGGWCIPPNLVTKLEDVDDVPDVVWSALHDALDEQEAASRPPLTVKMGTNHGDPTWRSTFEDHIAHFAMAKEITDDSSLHTVFKTAHAILGYKQLGDGPVLTMLTRTGPLAKPIRECEYLGGALHEVRAVKGVFCRRRQVRTVPTCFNEAIRPMVMANVRAYKAGYLRDCFAHGSVAANNKSAYDALDTVRQRAGSGIMIQDDASNFDDSVNIKHLTALYTKVYHCTPQERSLMLALTQAPILSGPLDAAHRAALYARHGTIPSGTITTTPDGTLINAAVVITCVAAALSVSATRCVDMLKAHDWRFRIQGDDTLLIVPAHFNVVAYVQRAAELGFKRTPGVNPIFLKTVHYKRGFWFNLSSRALIRCGWRERRAPGPYHELLGAAIRWELCLRDPYFRECFDAYTRNNVLAQRFGIREFGDFSRTIAAASFAGALEGERRRPQGEAMWADMIEDIGFSLSSRGLRDQRLDEGGDDLLEATALNDNLAGLILDRLGGLRSYLDRYKYTKDLDTSGFDWKAYLQKVALEEGAFT